MHVWAAHSDVEATQSILLHVWAAHNDVEATQSILLHVWAAHNDVEACVLLVSLLSFMITVGERNQT